MSFGITVKGGTGAGCKRPLKAAYTPWRCECTVECDGTCGGTPTETCDAKLNPGYLKRCIDCGTSRDAST